MSRLSEVAAEAGLLTLDDVARILGISPASVRTYHTNANRARREGKVQPQDMPAPDVVIVRTPTWRPASIHAWQGAREVAAREHAARLREPRPRAVAS